MTKLCTYSDIKNNLISYKLLFKYTILTEAKYVNEIRLTLERNFKVSSQTEYELASCIICTFSAEDIKNLTSRIMDDGCLRLDLIKYLNTIKDEDIRYMFNVYERHMFEVFKSNIQELISTCETIHESEYILFYN